MPPAARWDVSAQLSKRITEDFGLSVGDTWSQIDHPGGPKMAGFADLETTLQYQLLKNETHELAMLLGLIVDWGGTGASDSGIGHAVFADYADLLFRQRARRPARRRRMAARLRRPGRLATRFRPGRMTWCRMPSSRRCCVGCVGAIQMLYLKSEIADLQLPTSSIT